MINGNYVPNRTKFARIYYGAVVLFLLYRVYYHLMLSQLCGPVLTFTNTDLTYITLKWLGISSFLVQSKIAALSFDICLIGTALMAFVSPRYLPAIIAFTVLMGVYEVVGYSYLCFHKHNLTGLWVASLMFWGIHDKPFEVLFNYTRYYALFTYCSAGFWKFYRGVWNLKNHFVIVLKNDALPYMVEHTTTVKATLLQWLIMHPQMLDNIMLLTCFMQIAYVVGYFTKKLDWIFFLFAILFHLLSLLLLRAYFIEFGIILITLMPLKMLYRQKV